MRVIIRKTYEEMSKEATALVKKRLTVKRDLVLGLATGSTPLGLYRELVRMHKEEGFSFKLVRSFNLDEYYGLPPTHEQSYRYFMDTNLFDHLDIDKRNTRVPDGLAPDVEAFCREYEEAIKRVGGIDLQVLGIGGDGHIGFNEPGSSLASRTRLVALDEQTINDNSRFFARREDVPKFAITMGVGTVLEAKEIILLVNGEKKAEVLAKAIEGPVTSLISASALQFHPKVSVFLDEPAASALTRTAYYRFSEEAEKKLGREIF
ncbi:MAG: glucosamine-6-phosphate deaminase [Candidatus Omnitrophica bacterium]|nr:glucosamine-6-phosphate deaminase [Candidatus Omnitrophota bacterium]MCM8768377.1 glucosamine-6-phosphate deaminase [Candidatus Omnitrophota bacterium]